MRGRGDARGPVNFQADIANTSAFHRADVQTHPQPHLARPTRPRLARYCPLDSKCSVECRSRGSEGGEGAVTFDPVQPAAMRGYRVSDDLLLPDQDRGPRGSELAGQPSGTLDVGEQKPDYAHGRGIVSKHSRSLEPHPTEAAKVPPANICGVERGRA
jgi:hypothetical protein